jgi:hypothetical protein
MVFRRGGSLLYQLMSLKKIPDSEIEDVIELLQPSDKESGD